MRRGRGASRSSLLAVLLLAAALPAAAAGQEPTAAPQQPDTAAASRARHVEALLARIAGREQERASAVFENVELLGEMPAGRLLRVMDMGFGRSLGVACEHCHVAGEWASDEKRPKGVAREMWKLVGTINRELLPAIDGLQSERPAVNCTTCHRGATKPALDMPAAGTAAPPGSGGATGGQHE